MSFNFDHLANHIVSIQNTLSANAAHAVNLALTARNWLNVRPLFPRHDENKEMQK